MSKRKNVSASKIEHLKDGVKDSQIKSNTTPKSPATNEGYSIPGGSSGSNVQGADRGHGNRD